MNGKKRIKKKAKIIIASIIILIIAVCLLFSAYIKNEKEKIKEREILTKEIKQSYSKNVLTKKDAFLYKLKDKKYIKAGKISKDINLELNDIDKNYDKQYFKLKNINYYIKYTDIIKNNSYKLNFNETRYKNYIPFNENLVLDKKSDLYINDSKKYTVEEKLSLPILVKENDKIYVEYDKKFVYYLTENKNYKIVENINSDKKKSEHFAIVNYHYIVDMNNDKTCTTSLCTSYELFDSHLNYLAINNFYTLSMQEIEWFIDNKINLPEKSVAITIDDGWYATNVIHFLSKYNMKATLFLIGKIYNTTFDKNWYNSEYLDVHSHGFSLHVPGICDIPNTRGGAILCENHDELQNDLKKSREWLNNTTYFCYPFYEYNDYAINNLKEAGFTMAVAGGSKDVYPNIDKFKVPRYGTSSNTTVEIFSNIVN